MEITTANFPVTPVTVELSQSLVGLDTVQSHHVRSLGDRARFSPRQQECSSARPSELAVDHQPVHVTCTITLGVGPHIAIRDQVPQTTDHLIRIVHANEPLALFDLHTDIANGHLADPPLLNPLSREPQLARTPDPMKRHHVIQRGRPNDRSRESHPHTIPDRSFGAKGRLRSAVGALGALHKIEPSRSIARWTSRAVGAAT